MKKLFFTPLFIAVVSVVLLSCNQTSKKAETVVPPVQKESYGQHEGKEVFLLTLTNKSGNVVKLSNFGARITWIEVPDRDGNKENVTFGMGSSEEMLNGDLGYGAVVGRYANRIANGKFSLDGVEYTLPINNGPNCLHSGGTTGWHARVWDVEVVEGASCPSVKFTYNSPDMEAGFPGNVVAEVIYSWTDNNELILDYTATTDKKTVVNLTNHAYFNLKGLDEGDILDHELTIKASNFVPVNNVMIPLGEFRPVEATPFDFTTPHLVGERIDNDDEQLKIANGYDHTFIFDDNNGVVANVYEPKSGRLMEVETDQPGVQLYTGNALKGAYKGYNGVVLNRRMGICLETGHCADSPNQPSFASTILEPEKPFTTKTIYRFSVKQ